MGIFIPNIAGGLQVYESTAPLGPTMSRGRATCNPEERFVHKLPKLRLGFNLTAILAGFESCNNKGQDLLNRPATGRALTLPKLPSQLL